MNYGGEGREKEEEEAYLFSIVSDWLKNGTQRFETNGNVDEMAGEEEIVVIADYRCHEIRYQIEEGLQKYELEPSLTSWEKATHSFDALSLWDWLQYNEN